MTNRIFYLFDPLCGWCYGASPMLDQLRAGGVNIQAVPTGLFYGSGARPLDSAFAAYAWANDQRIQRLTQQHFSEAYRQNVLGKRGAFFDSGAMTLGIVAVGLADEQLRFDALRILQKRRYVDGLDTADKVVVAEILKSAGFHDAANLVLEPDDAIRSAVLDTVARGQMLFSSVRANGVPALVIKKSDALQILDSSSLYGSYKNLQAQLQTA